MGNQKWSLGFVCFAVFFISASSADFLIRQVIDAESTDSTNLKTNLGVTSELRDERPSGKIVTITSFSVIKAKSAPYESSVFEALGYQWRLVLYVKGKHNDGGENHISLYVRILPTNDLPSDWEVSVDLRLFVQNKKLNKYLTVTDGTMKKFNSTTKEWGFGQLIPLSTFYDTNEGYIVEDTCSFGAELVKPIKAQEKVTFISNPPNNIFRWKVDQFSTLEDKFYFSDTFLIGDRYWDLGFNPKGYGAGRPNALPIYLYIRGFKPNTTETSTWGQTFIRLKNQRNSNYKQVTASAWYPSSSGVAVGTHNIILLTELNDARKGYLVNDAIIFEIEMFKISVSNIIPFQ